MVSVKHGPPKLGTSACLIVMAELKLAATDMGQDPLLNGCDSILYIVMLQGYRQPLQTLTVRVYCAHLCCNVKG